MGYKGGSLETCSLHCEQNELPILDFQNDCFALAICGLPNGLTHASGPMSSDRVPRLVLFEVDISTQPVVDRAAIGSDVSANVDLLTNFKRLSVS